MSTPRRARPASPLLTRSDPGARTLTVIAAVTAFFAALALTGLAAGTELVSQWRWAFDGAVTVQIPASGDRAADTRLAADLALALEDLDQVSDARALGPQEIERLIEPWLGPLEAAGDIPLPRLVDIRLAPGAPFDLDGLRTRVEAMAPGAIVDDHGRWVRGLGLLALTVETAAAMILAIVASAVVLAVALASRTALVLHRETVDILHLMGAEDRYVAGLIARMAFRRAFFGGAAGLLLALVLLGMTVLIGDQAEAVLPPLSVGLRGWAAVLSLPAVIALISWVVARVSTMAALRQRV